MDVFEAIHTRRSIRVYTEKEVTDQQIEIMLKAAMAAPSARNYQPWHYLVIKDKEILRQIPEFHPYAKMVNDASVAIIVCGDHSIEKMTEYNNQNCSAATQNILLAAHGLGLGAVWLGVYPREQRVQGIKELCNLPDHILPISLISIGYPAEKKEKVDRYKPERVHYNSWKK